MTFELTGSFIRGGGTTFGTFGSKAEAEAYYTEMTNDPDWDGGDFIDFSVLEKNADGHIVEYHSIT